jgi:hypothetical protein
MIEIFLSRPTLVSDQFKQGLDEFLGLLGAMEFSPRTLGVSDYPAKGPMDEVIDLLECCEGMIVLGYPQLEITTGFVKMKPVSNVVLATEWNHIEASLAYARRIPLLVIHHAGVCRGIFDRGTLNSFVYERDLSSGGWALAPEIRGALAKWKSQIAGKPLGAVAANVGNSGAPSCPNCSTASKRFYLNLIPADFVPIERASHECSRCGFKLPVAVT